LQAFLVKNVNPAAMDHNKLRRIFSSELKLEFSPSKYVIKEDGSLNQQKRTKGNFIKTFEQGLAVDMLIDHLLQFLAPVLGSHKASTKKAIDWLNEKYPPQPKREGSYHVALSYLDIILREAILVNLPKSQYFLYDDLIPLGGIPKETPSTMWTSDTQSTLYPSTSSLLPEMYGIGEQHYMSIAHFDSLALGSSVSPHALITHDEGASPRLQTPSIDGQVIEGISTGTGIFADAGASTPVYIEQRCFGSVNALAAIGQGMSGKLWVLFPKDLSHQLWSLGKSSGDITHLLYNKAYWRNWLHDGLVSRNLGLKLVYQPEGTLMVTKPVSVFCPQHVH